MAVERQVVQGTQKQGSRERVSYGIDTARWGGTPVNPVVVANDVTSGTDVDVTVANLTGAASITGDTIALPLLHSVVPDHLYRIDVTFVDVHGNTLDCFLMVVGEE